MTVRGQAVRREEADIRAPAAEGSSSTASRLRAWLLVGLLLLVLLGISEGLSALAMFHLESRYRQASATVPFAELAWYHARELLTGKTRRHFSSEPSPLFVAHPTLGYTIAPGDYAIRIHDDMTDQDHVFRARVLADGSRATRAGESGDAGADPRPKIYLFGDSWVWGWGNQDEHTIGWLLQGWLPDRDVRNFAQSGYGNVQALVQLREMATSLRPDDVVVLGYGDFFDARNVAAPSRLREFRVDRDLQGGGAPLTHPRASLLAGRVRIDGVDLAGEHPERDPDPHAMQDVTLGILAEVAEHVPGPVVLAYLEGPDESPVLSRAGALGFRVADLRRRGPNEWDNFLPFDAHPGPLADFNMADKLYRVLLPVAERQSVGTASKR